MAAPPVAKGLQTIQTVWVVAIMPFVPAEYVIPTRPWPDKPVSVQEDTISTGGGYLPLVGGTMYGAINSENIIPRTNNVYDLGSAALSWSIIYTISADIDVILSGSTEVRVADHLKPNLGNIYDLGDTGKFWGSVYVTNVYADVIQSETAQAFIKVADSIHPNSSVTYDIGSVSLAWVSVFTADLLADRLFSKSAQDNITITDDFDPAAGNTHDLGDATLYWALAYAGTLYTDGLTALSGDEITVTADLVPNTNNTKDLGTTSKAWAIIYTISADIDTLLSSTLHVKVADDLDPNLGGLYDLGDATLYWQTGYIDDIYADTISSRSGISVNFQDSIDLGLGNHLTFTEMTAPGGATNTARVYAVVNGSSKTDLRVIFQSGASVLIATEP